MALRGSGRTLSFDVLSGNGGDDSLAHHSESDPLQKPPRTKKKKKHHKNKNKTKNQPPVHLVADAGPTAFLEENRSCYASAGVALVATVGAQMAECHSVYPNGCGELRLRNVSTGGADEAAVTEDPPVVETGVCEEQRRSEPNGSVVSRLETAESLDWKKLMAEDPNYLFSVEQSPMKYILDEMSKGNSLRSTTTLGSEKERERIYNTIFRLPWRCELLIDVGFFVCLDSFLSLLTIMPTRISTTLWRLLNTRQFKKLSAAELSDTGCFIVLACGVALLERTDISLIYHMIRGQGTIKLYVVYNVLEIFDKLCQNVGGDVLQTLFNSAEGLANCSPENMRFWIWRFIFDLALAMAFSNILILTLLFFSFDSVMCILSSPSDP